MDGSNWGLTGYKQSSSARPGTVGLSSTYCGIVTLCYSTGAWKDICRTLDDSMRALPEYFPLIEINSKFFLDGIVCFLEIYFEMFEISK